MKVAYISELFLAGATSEQYFHIASRWSIKGETLAEKYYSVWGFTVPLTVQIMNYEITDLHNTNDSDCNVAISISSNWDILCWIVIFWKLPALCNTVIFVWGHLNKLKCVITGRVSLQHVCPFNTSYRYWVTWENKPRKCPPFSGCPLISVPYRQVLCTLLTDIWKIASVLPVMQLGHSHSSLQTIRKQPIWKDYYPNSSIYRTIMLENIF